MYPSGCGGKPGPWRPPFTVAKRPALPPRAFSVVELEWMIEGGLPLSAAVQAATAVPARWLGVGDELGTIEPGKRADLVALAADPLSDARAWRTLWLVMKEGSIVRNDRWPR